MQVWTDVHENRRHGCGARRRRGGGRSGADAGRGSGLPRIVTVEMTAKRFAFLPEQVEVVEGDEVTINVRSADGTHGIEIEKLKVKKAIPRGGEVVTLSFTAPAPGRYVIKCSEYCGRGHDDMKSVLVVAARTR